MSQSEIKDLADRMKGLFIDRSAVIDSLLIGAISKRHCLLLGPPGVAKTELVTYLMASLGLDSVVVRLMHKFMKHDELFGRIDFSALKFQSKFQRVVKNTVVTADGLFLDEVFKCSPAILNTLLRVLNEGRYEDDAGADMPLPLQFAVGASNELPAAEDNLQALQDRFLIKLWVNPIRTSGDFSRLLSIDPDDFTKINPIKATLRDIRTEVKDVPLGDDIKKKIVEVRNQIGATDVYVSDRTWMKSLDIIRGCAYLSGHSQCELDDLNVLTNVLWTRLQDRVTIDKIISGIISPNATDIYEYLDKCHKLIKDLTPKFVGYRDNVSSEKLSAEDRDGANKVNHKMKAYMYEIDKLMKTLHPSYDTSYFVNELAALNTVKSSNIGAIARSLSE